MAEVQWRRKWKPDLFSCAWRRLDLEDTEGGKTFFIKAKFDDSCYDILITDLTHFWSETLADNALKKRVSKLNPSVEAPLTKILDQIKSSLDDRKDTRLFMSVKDDVLILKISSQLAGMPFSFNFHCERNEGDVGRDHLTIPLMAMVGELYRQQQELFKLLAAKDKEIDDYKAQGVKVTRKHNETVPFDIVAFRNSMITSKGFENEVKTYGEKAFTSLGQELYKEIATKRVWLTSAGGDGANDDRAGDETMDGVVTTGGPSVESWANRLPTSIAHPSPSKKLSPSKSPATSPASSKSSSTETTPVKDSEFLRRQALERKLEQEEAKQNDKVKKKKKLKF